MGRPDPGPSPASGLSSPVREAHRLADRLSAWARLFREQECPRPVLVTTSAAVAEHLLQVSAGARIIASAAVRGPEGSLIPQLAQWAAAPADWIAALPAANGGVDPELVKGGPSVIVFPGQAPQRFLSRLSVLDQGAEALSPGSPPEQHALLVLVPPDLA